MIKLITVLLMLFNVSYAFGKEQCGQYSIQGVIKEEKNKLFLVLNQNTISEKKISIARSILAQVKLHQNLRVLANVELKIDNEKNITIFNFSNLRSTGNNVLMHPDYINFLKEINCEK